jgi:hypothetical protein
MSLGMHTNDQPIRCGSPGACTTAQHAVQLYRNMYVCIDCILAPPKHCSGNHMCSFARWNWDAARDLPGYDAFSDVFTNDNNTYTRVFAALTWATRALTNQSFPSPVGATPGWVDFLEPYDFKGYNPAPLLTTFNNNMESLQGYCKRARPLPAFGECQNDGPRRTLRSFVQGNYKVPEGSVIRSKHTLTWFVDQNQMLHTNIPSWNFMSATSFFATLFDDGVCANGNIGNLMCYTNTSATLAMNPVISGKFEVREGCDVSEETGAIDGLCNAQVCSDPKNPDTADVYNTFQGTSFITAPNQTRCKIRHGATPGWHSLSPTTPVNLCSKRPAQPRTCGTRQGILGQVTFDGSQATSLYSRGAWPDLAIPSGLLSRTNPLLRFQTLASNIFGNITLDPTDIGGHYIRMVLRPSGVLAVTALPLRSYATLAQATAINNSDWVGTWKQYVSIESASMMDQFAMRTCMSWDCPLRRRAFWTAQHATFRPFSPNPFRTNVLYNSVTHPTTKPTPIPNGVLMKYQTRNGFCLCALGDACRPTSDACSAEDTIRSLVDKTFREAVVMQTACPSQIDWPWLGGTMRDGSFMQNKVRSCGILDRIPTFMY